MSHSDRTQNKSLSHSREAELQNVNQSYLVWSMVIPPP